MSSHTRHGAALLLMLAGVGEAASALAAAGTVAHLTATSAGGLNLNCCLPALSGAGCCCGLGKYVKDNWSTIKKAINLATSDDGDAATQSQTSTINVNPVMTINCGGATSTPAQPPAADQPATPPGSDGPQLREELAETQARFAETQARFAETQARFADAEARSTEAHTRFAEVEARSTAEAEARFTKELAETQARWTEEAAADARDRLLREEQARNEALQRDTSLRAELTTANQRAEAAELATERAKSRAEAAELATERAKSRAEAAELAKSRAEAFELAMERAKSRTWRPLSSRVREFYASQ